MCCCAWCAIHQPLSFYWLDYTTPRLLEFAARPSSSYYLKKRMSKCYIQYDGCDQSQDRYFQKYKVGIKKVSVIIIAALQIWSPVAMIPKSQRNCSPIPFPYPHLSNCLERKSIVVLYFVVSLSFSLYRVSTTTHASHFFLMWRIRVERTLSAIIKADSGVWNDRGTLYHLHMLTARIGSAETETCSRKWLCKQGNFFSVGMLKKLVGRWSFFWALPSSSKCWFRM